MKLLNHVYQSEYLQVGNNVIGFGVENNCDMFSEITCEGEGNPVGG